MSTLSTEEINTLIGKIKKFPYLVSVGSTSMAPLAGAPSAEPDVETADITLYEGGTEIYAKIITKNDVTLTIRTRNIEAAMPLLAALKKGDNVLDSTRKKVITMVPITGGTDATSGIITFDNAYLNAGLSYAPGEGNDPNAATLTFNCKADPIRGNAFVYGSTISQQQ